MSIKDKIVDKLLDKVDHAAMSLRHNPSEPEPVDPEHYERIIIECNEAIRTIIRDNAITIDVLDCLTKHNVAIVVQQVIKNHS